MIVSLNPIYVVRNEQNCSYLIRKNEALDVKTEKLSDSVTILPPSIGYILSNLGQSEIDDDSERLSKELCVSKESVKRFVLRLMGQNNKCLTVDGRKIVFPAFLIVEIKEFLTYQTKYCSPNYKSAQFKEIRPFSPINVNLMVTTKCSTNCRYCYAKRSFSYEMTSEEICSIIDQCYDIGVVNLTLTGGDVFVSRDWKQILIKCKKCGYSPFISTKTPLSISSLNFLCNIGFKHFQFSLDSSDVNLLSSLISVDRSYILSVQNMLSNADDMGINISIRTVLTKQTATQDNINNLYEFLNQHKCIRDWVLTPAFFSEFKKDYAGYEVTNDALKEIYALKLSTKSRFPVYFNKVANDGYCLKRSHNTHDFVENNQKCYANSFSMSILPSGKCTICEMLYEKEEFCIGNVLTDSILSIWNSDKALMLYKPIQQNIDPISPCYSE